MDIKPLADQVLVRPITEDEYKGEFYIPPTARQKQDTGIVLKLGTGALKRDGSVAPFDLAPGDKIMWPKVGAAYEIFADGEQLICVSERDVTARIG